MKSFKLLKSYKLFILLYLIFILFGLIIDNPSVIITGFRKILFESNILITDYIKTAGIGATFINASFVSLICILILIYLGVKPNGAIVAALFTMTGFSFFGKNIFNIWPIIFGVWLYSKYQKQPFLNYILIALFGTTLSPAVNQLKFSQSLHPIAGLLIGILISILIGFMLPSVASYCLKLHEGYNLYNTGFAAGLIGTVLMSILRAFGIDFDNRILWSTNNNLLFALFLFSLFILMIIIGYTIGNSDFKNLKKLFNQSGRLITDFYIMYGKGTTLINMGILGLFSTSYILLIKGDLNGPTIGGIFTIVGFGAFGKHIKNILPVIIGTILCSLINIWPINSPSMQLAVLFSTTLAPIAGHFGWFYGLLAGFLHVCIVMNVSYLHGGLNLYNNGFAGGIVVIILLPVITAFRKE